VAAILHERCRKTDMIARYGGEEFLICFPHTDLEQARTLCEALRAAVETADWSFLTSTAGVTISFGVADLRADTAPRAVLGRADRNLYAAKNRGRNRIVA
jgi:diguanylate cyclase (GGDEF)-like protein